MTDVMLRPDMKTTGGEVNDILWNHQFVGSMTLVYREADRICGAIQLEQSMLPPHAKQAVMSYLQEHIQALIDAMDVESCDVLVTYSEYDHVIATDRLETAFDNVEEDYDYDYNGIDQDRFEDEDSRILDEYVMQDDTDYRAWDGALQDEPVVIVDEETDPYFELVILSESRNKVEYHVYDQDQELVAEVDVHVNGPDISGTVHWNFEPDEDEIEAVTELLVSDFDEDEVDTFVLHMEWAQDIIETIELTHEDLLMDDPDTEEWTAESSDEPDKEDYTIVLARDDGDMLTYEIYQQSHGGLPIGTATIDISYRQITGFIDFREPGNADDRETIAELLMQELDKEKDYESFNVTMLYQNKPFEELLFESEQIH